MTYGVIDHQPLNGELISYVIGRECPDVRYVGQAFSIRHGINLVSSLKPDFVFLNMTMPGEDCFKALKNIHTLLPDTHIVAIVPADNFSIMQAALKQGANDYLTAPIKPSEVVNSVEYYRNDGLMQPTGGTSPAQEDETEYFMSKLMICIQKADRDSIAEILQQFLFSSPHSEKHNIALIKLQLVELASRVLQLFAPVGGCPEEMYIAHYHFIRTISECTADQALYDAVYSFIEASIPIVQRFFSKSDYQQITAIKKYVEEHLGEHLTIERMAEQFYLSPSHFCRIFKERTGQTFTAYLADCRVLRAKILLSSTEIPIAEIAESLGYQNTNSFSRLFKLSTGSTPSQIRKNSSK